MKTTMKLLAEKSAGYFMSSFGPIALFMDLFCRLLCVVSVNICTPPPVFVLNAMKRLLDLKLCRVLNFVFFFFLMIPHGV